MTVGYANNTLKKTNIVDILIEHEKMIKSLMEREKRTLEAIVNNCDMKEPEWKSPDNILEWAEYLLELSVCAEYRAMRIEEAIRGLKRGKKPEAGEA